jgi:uncharacterized membrane protein
MNKKFFLLLYVAVLVTIQACTYEKDELLQPPSGDCTTTPAKYNADIKPIIQTKCAISNCHNTATAAGGVAFTDYNSVKLHTDHIMERVVIIKDMPTTGPLPNSEILKIKCWIDSGAPNN